MLNVRKFSVRYRKITDTGLNFIQNKVLKNHWKGKIFSGLIQIVSKNGNLLPTERAKYFRASSRNMISHTYSIFSLIMFNNLFKKWNSLFWTFFKCFVMKKALKKCFLFPFRKFSEHSKIKFIWSSNWANLFFLKKVIYLELKKDLSNDDETFQIIKKTFLNRS